VSLPARAAYHLTRTAATSRKHADALRAALREGDAQIDRFEAFQEEWRSLMSGYYSTILFSLSLLRSNADFFRQAIKANKCDTLVSETFMLSIVQQFTREAMAFRDKLTRLNVPFY
jgi:hypothetical protein